MLLRAVAILFGIAFIFIGVAGFLSTFMVNGLLFGYFEVNLARNLFYLVTGVLAIMTATSYSFSRGYFQFIGVIYALLAIAGFVLRGDLSFIMMHTNFTDNLFHLIVAVVALLLGFYTRKRQVNP